MSPATAAIEIASRRDDTKIISTPLFAASPRNCLENLSCVFYLAMSVLLMVYSRTLSTLEHLKDSRTIRRNPKFSDTTHHLKSTYQSRRQRTPCTVTVTLSRPPSQSATRRHRHQNFVCTICRTRLLPCTRAACRQRSSKRASCAYVNALDSELLVATTFCRLIPALSSSSRQGRDTSFWAICFVFCFRVARTRLTLKTVPRRYISYII